MTLLFDNLTLNSEYYWDYLFSDVIFAYMSFFPYKMYRNLKVDHPQNINRHKTLNTDRIFMIFVSKSLFFPPVSI